MSRTDPQFNLRIPESLRDKVMAASKENGRSATAEILARLELSFIGESTEDELVPASRAWEMAAIARQSIPATVKKRILEGINRAISMGHETADINLKDLELESLPSEDVDSLISEFSSWLSSAGYVAEWDGPESIWIRFEEM